MMKDGRRRIYILLGLILILGVVAIFRLFYLQIIRGDYYSEYANRQYTKTSATFFNRGSIYFKDKKGNLVAGATLTEEYALTVNPQMIKDPQALVAAISPLVDFDQAAFAQKIKKPNSQYEEIATGIGRETALNIGALHLPGVFLIKQKKRYYPGGETAAHVLGFMGYLDDTYSGRYGLEKEYNDFLNRSGNNSFGSFFAELFLGFGRNLLGDNSKREGDLILTIEPVVQNTVEQTLKDTISDWDAASGGAMIVDPNTGAVIAMAAYPSFSPGGRIDEVGVLQNPLVEKVFELGSIIKPLTLAAGFDAGVVNPKTTLNDPGFIKIYDRTLNDHDKKPHGIVSMQDVINQSLNVGAVFVMQKLGTDRFRDYFLNKYELGEATGIDLPNEVNSLVGSLKPSQPVEHATASFGQGIALSPVSAVRAFSALANGGKMVNLHVVEAKRFGNGDVEEVGTSSARQAISPKAAREISDIMTEAFDTALSGGKYKIPNYQVAAKTGTAQIPSPNGAYYDDRFLHSFFGFFPASKPKYLIFMYLVYPKNGAQFSSDTLAKPFTDLTNFMINYYEIPPDR